MEIKINTVGKIIKGEYLGWYVKVQNYDDGDDYLILQSTDKDFNPKKGEGYDHWVKNEEYLYYYFEGSEWVIDWLD